MMAESGRSARRPPFETLRIEGDPLLYLELHGAGPLLVLVHGFGGSGRNFRPQARVLRERFRVALLDVRGHARSGSPQAPQAYEPQHFVDDFLRILDALDAAEAVLGGLSMGAALALRFALEHPQRVRGLVLASPPPASPAQTAWARAFAAAIEAEGLEAAGERFVWGEQSRFDAAAARAVRAGFLEHAPHALAHTLRQVLATQPTPAELAPHLARLTRPILLVTGSRDRISRDTAAAWAAALPQVERVEIEGAGHVVNLEAPDAFNTAVMRFVDRLR